MSGKRTYAEQIEAAQLEIKQREERIKLLRQKERTQKNKDRTHRICKRGGYMESILPDLIKLTDEQFELFAKKCLLTGFTSKIITELLQQKFVDETEVAQQEVLPSV